MNVFIFVSIALLGIVPLLHATNLTLTFEAIDNTCIAQCATPLDNTQLIQHLINATLNNTQAINDLMTKLDSVIVSLTQLKNTTDSNAGGINDILLLVEQILNIRNTSCDDIMALPTSCQDIKNNQPDSPSGLYLLANSIGETKYVYCHMGELCGVGGGWIRLAYLNMSDSTETCPCGFRLHESTGGVRACGRSTSNSGSCVSVQFPSNAISYSQVCGRVVGYQIGTPDAVDTTFIPESHDDINSFYVDGVSITHGFPRQHVWTLMAGLFGSMLDSSLTFNCPCSQQSTQTVQSFIGQDYFCESGSTTTFNGNTFYTGDPLWDGEGCGTIETDCCSFPGLPWFHKVLNSTTTDYIELRVCADQETSDEDVAVGFYEIFVK